MAWYIVYTGKQKYRDGTVRERVRVRKIRNLPRGVKPRIVKVHRQAGEIWVTIEYEKPWKTRAGTKYMRKITRDIHLGKPYGRKVKIQLTQHPPKGPKIDRKKRRKKP